MLDREKQADFKAISLSLFAGNRAYPIAGYATLFRPDTQNREVKIQMVKKSIAESKPVVIAMNCPDSFFAAHDVWRPWESSSVNHGGHAMCAVGYDDGRHGGAFEIQNSLGEKWVNGGYTWIPCDVFSAFVREAYGLSENLGNYQAAVKYEGFASIEVRGGAEMTASFRDGYYEALSPYRSVTRFRYLLGNREAANVYAFAAEGGSFPGRVARAVGQDYIPPSQVKYEPNRLSFTASSAVIDAPKN
ncbi:MAG: hypothetical protein LBG07_00180 [Treponema sp.]|jgi:hypothetical protein|nr:hypothetical protein [Treponema sp.]